MRNISLFVEDRAHEAFLGALVRRIAKQHKISVAVRFSIARGGYGKVVSKLKEYISDLQSDQEYLPDLLIVATDGNCKGHLQRRRDLEGAMKGFSGDVVYAIPDPHVERWLLLDTAAFKIVLGKGCSAPPQKCERDLYKRLLLEAVRETGVNPPLGGIEYAEDIVNVMNLHYLERTEESFGKLLRALRHKFQEWERIEHGGSQEFREDQAPYAPHTETESPQP